MPVGFSIGIIENLKKIKENQGFGLLAGPKSFQNPRNSSEIFDNPWPSRLGTRISRIPRAEPARAGRVGEDLAGTVGALQIGSKNVKTSFGNDALDGYRCVERWNYYKNFSKRLGFLIRMMISR